MPEEAASEFTPLLNYDYGKGEGIHVEEKGIDILGLTMWIELKFKKIALRGAHKSHLPTTERGEGHTTANSQISGTNGKYSKNDSTFSLLGVKREIVRGREKKITALASLVLLRYITVYTHNPTGVSTLNHLVMIKKNIPYGCCRGKIRQ
ncbi:hypothetical protein POVCU1_013170 [Plasmodium ovale curtisi]|uniref:Uncharacterized protein n=1 Tax=Plasmodium ovale curtisi TaxID=864141 RepID=A0A1A8W288_PLAOA|nr:hypothetical protein POVCU1_013170 [Plasmodium ovale curtisi]